MFYHVNGEGIMANHQKDTVELFNYLKSVKNEKDLQDYLSYVKGQELSFSQYYNDILAKKNISLNEARVNSGLSKGYAYDIINGKKTNPSKNKILALIVSAHMDVKEANKALRLINKGSLDPKNPRDFCVISHLLHDNYDINSINQEIYDLTQDESLLLL